MINFYNNEKVAIIADLHFGIHSNSEMWHKIQLDYGKWLKGELDRQNIKDLIILGDIFNDREEIGVQTLSVTEQFFRIFTDPILPCNILLLAGNHDAYLKDNTSINSISVFKGWNNIHVIDLECSLSINNKTFTFLPWNSDIKKIYKSDVIFGHMEINTFKKNVTKLCEDGIDSTLLLDNAKLIISGHFHLREERNYSNGKIIYVGSPYGQTWNDAGSTKGYYLLNIKDLTTEFHENTISPKYHRIKLSEFFDNNNLPNIRKIIPNNFIKIQADKQIEYDKFEKVLNVATLLNPLELSSDFTNTDKQTIDENYESVHLDTETMLSEFIDSLLDIDNIKSKVLKRMEEIYKKSITKVKIENE